MSTEQNGAEPGVAPGSRLAAPLYLALHGALDRHPGPEPDAYSLFHSRSAAMGWLSDQYDAQWGMNDAGWATPADPTRVAWFQVDAEAEHTGLPLQPLLSCALDVVARAGTLTLRTVHLLTPARQDRPGPDPVRGLFAALPWFDDREPTTDTTLTIDGGTDAGVVTAADAALSWIDTLHQGVWATTRHAADRSSTLAGPVEVDGLWPGSSGNSVTVHGRLVDGSAGIGWSLALIAEALRRHGATDPMRLTLAVGHGAQ